MHGIGRREVKVKRLEDYLYPADRFVPLRLGEAALRALRRR
jgi:hypothetical protein